MKLELQLELVTPVFIGGAEPNTTGPEWRAAAVRGALRYWLRALLGRSLGDDLDALRKRESTVFGEAGAASPVCVRLLNAPRMMADFNLDRSPRRDQLLPGLNYLYYSTRLGDNRRSPWAPEPPGAPAPPTLVLSTRPGVGNGQELLRYAGAATWLLVHLGALGMRSRRCAGSLQATGGSLEGIPPFATAAADSASLRTELEAGLRAIGGLEVACTSPARGYDTLHPDVCRVWTIGSEAGWPNWKDAVDAIGSGMQKFRAGQGLDRNQLNSIFGVPILHGPSYGLKRRGSPVWLRITRLASGGYVGVATLFACDFSPGSREVGGGYRLIEEFVASAMGGQQVSYA